MIFNFLNAHVLYPLAEKKLGRDIRGKSASLLQEAKLSPREREQLLQKKIHQVLKVAGESVPYYRDLFKEIDFSPDSVMSDLKYLHELPYLTKEIIQEQGSRMIHQNFKKEQLHVRKTGGSTGISTLIYYDQPALDWTAAVNLYAQSFTGRKTTDTEAHLSTEFFQKQPFKARFVEQIKCWAMNRENILTHSFNDEALQNTWDTIRRVRPYLIQGHPSTLYALAKFIERTKQFDRSAIKVFESTGESVDQKKLESIEANVGCKVFNRYGTAEFGVTAHSRQNAHELEIIESIIHHETVSLGNGLEEIVGTGLTNFAMPLIRYRSGDIGQIETRDEKKVITHLQGRVHDLIEINGHPYPTHYLQDVLDRVGGVSEFQIVIRTSGKRILNVVLEQMENKDAVVARVNELFGAEEIPVKFVKLEDLVRIGWRDKFRYIVKEI